MKQAALECRPSGQRQKRTNVYERRRENGGQKKKKGEVTERWKEGGKEK